tara:strand:+ start:80 stop:571 length:492 start_codon:yes stop_codon:yes gene_type:complete
MITFDEYYSKYRNKISASGFKKEDARKLWNDNLDKVEELLNKGIDMNATSTFSGNNIFWRLSPPKPDYSKDGYIYFDIRKSDEIYNWCVNNPHLKKQNVYRRSKYIVERKLGRYLHYDHTGKKETVHHINGDKTDDRWSNLELWNGVHPQGVRAKDVPGIFRD